MWSITICRLSRVTMLDGRIIRGIQSLLLPLKINRIKIQSTKHTCRMELIHFMEIDKILHILLINSDENQKHGKSAPDCTYTHWSGPLLISLIFVIIGQVKFFYP